MFQNPLKTQTKLETVIGPNSELEGNVRTKEAIRVDGKIKGEISAESVVIGQHGVVLGDVVANHVTVEGKVKGNISASSLLEMFTKGQILGDIRTAKLIIADGAIFEGNCQMVKADGQIIEMNPDALPDSLENQKNLKVVPANNKR